MTRDDWKYYLKVGAVLVLLCGVAVLAAPPPDYEGYQDLSDCMACDYHVGLEVNYVVCAFAQGKKKVEE